MKFLKKTVLVFLLTGTVFFISSYSSSFTNLSLSDSLMDRVAVPDGYKRMDCASGSFGEWSRKIILKPKGAPVKLYDGSLKGRQNVHFAVLDIDCGDKNLQQCADAVIRLRAEYLFSNKKIDEIKFHYTSGDLIPFGRWEKGERPVVKGNKVSWSKGKPACSDYNCLKNYLFSLFNYAGTLSVAKETKQVTNIHDVLPGDIFVVGGSPGHAVTVLDVAVNEKTGKKIFLLCQSYMPAQDIHILKNFNSASISPWYSEDFGETLETPEWDFSKDQLRRY